MPSRWATATDLVSGGSSPDEALRQAGVRDADRLRLVGPGAGAWTELVDVSPGSRVLVAEPGPSEASVLLSSRGAHVTVLDDCARRRAFRRAALPEGTFALPDDDERGALADRGRFDLVTVECGQSGWPGGGMAAMADLLETDGELVLLCENRLSPLRAVDRLRGEPLSGGPAWLGRLEREGRRLGFRDIQVFGLLRSALAPTTAFDLSARQTSTVVLEAAKPYAVGVRKLVLNLMIALARLGLAKRAIPAWLVVLRRETPAQDRLVRRSGRISFFDSWEGKVVWGEPPRHLEKRYRNGREADAEHHALALLAGAAVDMVPRVIERSAADRLVLSWTPGHTLEVAGLSSRELFEWIGRAASTLALLHEATRRDDGTVLVHGDYWLGNLLIEADRIVGVIDWSESYRGQPEDDLRFLVESLLDLHPKARALRGRLTQIGREAYASPSSF